MNMLGIYFSRKYWDVMKIKKPNTNVGLGRRSSVVYTRRSLVSIATPMILQLPLTGISGHAGFNPFR